MKLNKEIIWNRIDQHKKEDIQKANDLVSSDKYYRPTYHIAPPNGLLNDPNGLLFKDGQHYIHYQWSPLQPYHGYKHWMLVKTKDFVNYKDLGVSIIPNIEDEIHGAFSGSAFEEKNGDVTIYYTGNIEDGNGTMLKEVQIAADFKDEKVINKRTVVKHDETLFTAHARDPKIFEYKGEQYMIFGAQCKTDLKGGLVFYKKTNKDEFIFDRIIKPSLNENYGHMWECPNLDFIDNKYLFFMSAEGWFNENDRYELNGSRNVVYTILEDLDFDNSKLNEKEVLKMLDYGHDYYAPQTYWANNKLVSIAWLGAVDVQYPTDVYSWHSMLTIPREMNIVNNKLIQKPYSEFKKNVLENTKNVSLNEFKINKAIHFEFELEGNLVMEILNDQNEKIEIKFDNNEIVLDRSKQTESPTWDYETTRQAKRIYEKQIVEIYIDSSSIEIFCNNYETTFTSRFFIKDFNKITFSREIELKVSEVKSMILNK
ncbi:glycoside hydrolase family 32 protein [Spiroplasma diminutum]|uniref:beta-fructofuranosidase n=1 Tax=Spiroplasma diminutum CUAS-1 TaxID=1276221 RepID=S5LVK4_9MOLU|nr:GH32 C-terminal domain-containing protein [Spiroplasma diminutum]AGR41854.1 sucrose-6-phosphate hydrolase [Spiroplasma diminutum CUAS-1]